MKISLILSLFFMFSFGAFTQESAPTEFMIINKPTFEGLPEVYLDQIVKTSIDVTLKTGKYQLAIGAANIGRKAKGKFFELRVSGKLVKWGEDRIGFDIDISQMDAKRNKLIKSVKRTRIEERRLIFTIRKMLYELYYGEKVMKQKRARIKREAAADLAELTERLEEEVGTLIINLPVKEAITEVDEVEEEPIVEDPFEPERTEVPEALTKRGEIERKKAAASAQKELSFLEQINQPGFDGKTKGNISYRKTKKNWDLGLKYQTYRIDSTTSNLSVINNLSYAGPYVTYYDLYDNYSTNAFVATIALLRPVEQDEFSLGNNIFLSAGHLFRFDEIDLDLEAHLTYQTHNFINLPEIGAGLQNRSQEVLWLRGVVRSPELYRTRLYFEFGKSFVAKTDLDSASNVPLDASQMIAGIQWNFWRSLELNINAAQTEFISSTSSLFENKEESFSMSLNYKIR